MSLTPAYKSNSFQMHSSKVLSHVVFPTEESVTLRATKWAWSDMLRFNVPHQDSFAGEYAGVWAVFPIAPENSLGVTYMIELLLVRL